MMKRLAVILACLMLAGCLNTNAPQPEPLALDEPIQELLLQRQAGLDAFMLEGKPITLRDDPWPGHNEIEDGDIRLLTEVIGRTVFVDVQFKNVSAWWLDSTWVGHVIEGGIYERWPNDQCFPCLCYEDVPIISFAAGGMDVGHYPTNAVRNVTAIGGDMFGESCGFDWGDPGPGPIWCAFASRWSGPTARGSRLRAACSGRVAD
jgi:hypothetical protein